MHFGLITGSNSLIDRVGSWHCPRRRRCGVVVITLDFESNNPSSTLGSASLFLDFFGSLFYCPDQAIIQDVDTLECQKKEGKHSR